MIPHRRTATLATLVLVTALAAPAAAQYPTTPPPAGPLREVRFPPYREATLSNRLQLLVVENHELPIVSIALAMPAGSMYDPAGLEGLAGFVAELITKGTTTRSAELIAETIEGVGGFLNAGADQDFFTISATVLTEHLPLAVELIGDVLRNATYPEEELSLARRRVLSGLQAQKADPGALAERYFVASLYGDHPYGRQPTEESVTAITRAAVREHAATRLKPRGSLLVVAGDVDLRRVRELAQRHLAAWTGVMPPTQPPAPLGPRATDILLVHRPGSAQSRILLGNLAFRPGDPRHYAAVIANRVLGGGSDARLFRLLREEKGWTYGAYSGITRPREVGSFRARAEVRTPVTDSALVALLEQLRRIRAAAPADSELAAAKGYLVGSFPRQIETPQQIADQVSTTRLLGLGDDYLRTYRERLSAVTPEAARRAAADMITPDSAVIVVVGDGQAIYEKLASIAPVRIVDVDGNPLTPADLAPEVAALELDPGALRPGRYEYQMVFNDNPVGRQVVTISRDGGTIVLADSLDLGLMGMRQHSRVLLDGRTLAVRTVEQSTDMRGQQGITRLEYAGDRVRGTVAVPQRTGTIDQVDVDTTVAPGTVDMNALQAVIPALALEPGTSVTVNVFDSSQLTIWPLTLTVDGTEEISVPAGTFPAVKIELSGGPQPMIFYVTRDTPRQIVKIQPVGQPVRFELVERR